MKTSLVPGGVKVEGKDGGQLLVPGLRVRGGVWLSVGGEALFFPDAEAQASAVASGPGAPLSPMPGRVVKVFVTSGDAVKAGDPLAAVEAMKMEYLVRAPGDGVVTRVLCQQGQTVAQGQKLADWEPA